MSKSSRIKIRLVLERVTKTQKLKILEEMKGMTCWLIDDTSNI